MRKKLDTRFPASRIKKIMQADEDVGKIALPVPLLVSKALELFLQDLCDRTYDITLQRGAKTVSSLHLKQCVQSFNVFDFLREIVSKVPDLGSSDAGGEDRPKRRRHAVDEVNDSEEEGRRSRATHEVGNSSGTGRGRGRPRGTRGRGRGGRAVERENAHLAKCEDDLEMSPQHDKQSQRPGMNDDGIEAKELTENVGGVDTTSLSNTELCNIDLNVGLDENEPAAAPAGPVVTPTAAAATATASTAPAAAAPTTLSASTEPPRELKQHEEYPGWSMSDMDKMAIDPLQLAQLNNRRLEEEEENYDEEEEE